MQTRISSTVGGVQKLYIYLKCQIIASSHCKYLENVPVLLFYIGELIYINLCAGQSSQRLGGSALAQVYRQIGNESPDLDDADLFSRGFKVIQQLIKGKICKHANR